MTSRKVLFVLMVTAALLLQACGASAEAVATSVAATLQISQLETAAAGGGQPSGSSTEESGTPSGEPTVTGTITPTPTSGVPLVSVSQDTNCRRGPRIDYSYVTTIEAGQQVEVLKTFPGANYVVVRNPNGSGDCWLWLQYANQTDFSTYGLAVATQPPTPTPSQTPTKTPTATPIYTWNGNWNIWNGDAAAPYALTTTQTGNSVTGSYVTCTISGTLSADWRTLTGTWDCSGPTGTFVFYMLDNLNQVVGNWDMANEFCAARNGAGKPAPCLYP